MPTFADLSPGVVVEAPILPEPVEVLATVPMGASLKLIAKGLRTGQVRDPILELSQLSQLTLTPKEPPFDGDSLHFKLGVLLVHRFRSSSDREFRKACEIPPFCVYRSMCFGI
ncbi:MAG: hypothetical protein HYV07_04185 [Deltaproteobacteria bacterium]|nr:hypothetical protein [Deltaproteobacteria bacterium]